MTSDAKEFGRTEMNASAAKATSVFFSVNTPLVFIMRRITFLELSVIKSV